LRAQIDIKITEKPEVRSQKPEIGSRKKEEGRRRAEARQARAVPNVARGTLTRERRRPLPTFVDFVWGSDGPRQVLGAFALKKSWEGR
jgi:hypothetical protein